VSASAHKFCLANISLDHEMSFIPVYITCIAMQNSSMSATKGSYTFPNIFTHVNTNLSQVALTLFDVKRKFIVNCRRNSGRVVSDNVCGSIRPENIIQFVHRLQPKELFMSFVISSRQTLIYCFKFFHNCSVPPPHQVTIYFSTDAGTRPEFMAECKI
jgi:hypothetical protein